MSFYDHSFEGAVVPHDVGSQRYNYTVIWVPKDILSELPLRDFPKLRIQGELACQGEEIILDAALTPARGNWYILVSGAKLKALGARINDVVSVRFTVSDQEEVVVPDVLQTELENDLEFARSWQNLTAGKKRALAHRVASAKRLDTIAKRLIEVKDVASGKRDLRGNPIA